MDELLGLSSIEDSLVTDDMNRIIYLTGAVDESMYLKLVKGLIKFQKHRSVGIVLMTHGGELETAFAMYDLLIKYQSDGGHVTIFCSGPVMSAGTVILQAASKRIMMPNSNLLVHYGWQASDSEQAEKYNKALHKTMKTMIAERVNVKRATVNKWFTVESYFDAQRALEVGLVDEVY